ncbi:hypothetical protein L6R52_24955 [Myxococcota bacterium]|nr:hypothetical protein [Myxococcota bacterium]
MRARLPATLITPLVFWACGSANMDVPPMRADASTADAGARDASAAPDADAVMDASDGTPDAADVDAGFAPDAAEPDAGDTPDSGPPPCSYPASPARPMALDQVLFPYAWPAAIDGAGTTHPIDLAQFHCNSDPNIDWTSFEHLLFVSIPAW